MTSQLLLFALFAGCLILANRDASMFADAENYSEYFDAVGLGHEINAEPSFVFIADFVNSINLDVAGLFFIYLLLSLFLKGAFFILKMPNHLHISLLYFTSYFIVHDLVQIRIGAALGVALWAVFLLGEKKLWASLFLWLFAFSLHFSSLLLAILSILLYVAENNKVSLSFVRYIASINMIIGTTLLLGAYFWNLSFILLLTNLLSDTSVIPQRYIENYIDSGGVVGFEKIIYSFTLGISAVYALYKRMLAGFMATHAAVSMTFAFLILVAFKDMPVIGSRFADILLFFTPFLVFGVYRENKMLGQILFLWILFVQSINLIFFSKVIFI